MSNCGKLEKIFREMFVGHDVNVSFYHGSYCVTVNEKSCTDYSLGSMTLDKVLVENMLSSKHTNTTIECQGDIK